MLLAGTLFIATIGFRFLPDHKTFEIEPGSVDNTHSDVPAWKKKASLIVLIVTILGMVFEKQIGIPLHITGAIAAITLVLLGVISETDAYKSIDTKTLFLFGGILSLATAMQKLMLEASLLRVFLVS